MERLLYWEIIIISTKLNFELNEKYINPLQFSIF